MRRVKQQERWLDVGLAGAWVGPTAGGCRNHDTWDRNPQYQLTFSEPTTQALLVLSQPASEKMKAIGFYVISNNGTIVGKGPFMLAPEVHCAITVEQSLSPYLIVPCTFAPGEEAQFNLKAYTRNGCELTAAVP